MHRFSSEISQTSLAALLALPPLYIMVVRIRLSMHGRRHNRIFHLVAINGRKARDAKPMETLGVYDPAMKLGEKHKTVEWSVGRINYWLGVGAVPSKTVVRLLEVVSMRKFRFYRPPTDAITGRCHTTRLEVPPQSSGSSRTLTHCQPRVFESSETVGFSLG